MEKKDVSRIYKRVVSIAAKTKKYINITLSGGVSHQRNSGDYGSVL